MDIGTKVVVGMAAAAGPILLPTQDMTLRGSLASQSLTAAADAALEVVNVAEQVGGIGMESAGNTTMLEVVGKQVAGALLPMAVTGAANALRGACAHRSKSEPTTPLDPDTPEFRPPILQRIIGFLVRFRGKRAGRVLA